MNRLTLCAAVTALALLPFPTQANELPVHGDDLGVGQRFSTTVHLPGDLQNEGHDIGLLRHVSDGDWSNLKQDGANVKVLTNWNVYGKPFYAMAPGTVIACWRNAPDNTPGSLRPEVKAQKIPGGGNHFWIRQDNGVFVLYAHAKPGSIPASLCPHNNQLLQNGDSLNVSPYVRKFAAVTNGVHIKTGQFLGRIGNSGESAHGPHLHVHMVKNDTPVVMKFDHGMTMPFPGGEASFAGKWTKLEGKAIPKTDVLLWPPHPVGKWTYNGTPQAEYQSFFDHMDDSGNMLRIVTCNNGGEFYNSNWIPAKGLWFSLFGMNDLLAATQNALFTAKGFTRTSSFTCGSVSVAVWRK